MLKKEDKSSKIHSYEDFLKILPPLNNNQNILKVKQKDNFGKNVAKESLDIIKRELSKV